MSSNDIWCYDILFPYKTWAHDKVEQTQHTGSANFRELRRRHGLIDISREQQLPFPK